MRRQSTVSVHVSPWTLFTLAAKDLRHELMLSACLIVALAGVVAPLLVLFGLKSGVMETLRSKLVNDPVYRELKPEETRQYSAEFFQQVAQLDQTQFVIGNITKGASVIRLDLNDGNKQAKEGKFVDMLPSATGDPLLVEYGVTPPDSGEVVLSYPIAASLQLKAGDAVTLSSSRTEDGKRRLATAPMVVVGVLPERADAIERVYVPLQFAVDVESFREGFSIDARGWEGASLRVDPVYHGVVVALNRTLSSSEQQRAINNTGFFIINPMSAEDFAERFHMPAPDNAGLYDIAVIDNPVLSSALKRLESRLSGTLIADFAYVRPMPVELQLPDGGWQSFELSGSTMVANEQVSLPAALHGQFDAGSRLRLKVQSIDGSMPFEGSIGTANSSGQILVSQERAGVLLNAQDNAIGYEASTGSFISRPSGYRGFRLFSRNINDVEALGDQLRSMGVETKSSVLEILRLKALDTGLTSLFAVIAALGLGTGAIVFLASQYGAVQRKRSALAHLRLMGLARKHVAAIPLMQGACIALLGALLGGIVTYAISWVINHWFAQPLGFEGQVSVIRPVTLVVATGILLVLSLIASLGAALSATRIDPADGMRNE